MTPVTALPVGIRLAVIPGMEGFLLPPTGEIHGMHPPWVALAAAVAARMDMEVSQVTVESREAIVTVRLHSTRSVAADRDRTSYRILSRREAA